MMSGVPEAIRLSVTSAHLRCERVVPGPPDAQRSACRRGSGGFRCWMVSEYVSDPGGLGAATSSISTRYVPACEPSFIHWAPTVNSGALPPQYRRRWHDAE